MKYYNATITNRYSFCFYTNTGNTDIINRMYAFMGQLLMMYHHLLSTRARYELQIQM